MVTVARAGTLSISNQKKKRTGRKRRFVWMTLFLGMLPSGVFFIAAIVGFCRRNVAALGVDNIVSSVFVVVFHPSHAERETFFVAPFRSEIEEVVSADKNVQAARVGGIRMEDVPRFIFVEGAEAGAFFEVERNRAEVIVRLFFVDVLLGEGNFVIEIEIGSVRRDPIEFPAHAFLEGLNLRERRA